MSTILSGTILMLMCLCSCKHSNKDEVFSNKVGVNSEASKGTSTLYEDLEGKPIDLSAYKGKKMILNFWATWCKPCVDEMPSLELSKSLLEKENYMLLLVSNESIKEIKTFKSKTNFNLDFIRFRGTLSELKIHALPTTFIYDEEGGKVTEVIGARNWSTPEMILKLKNINEEN